MFCFFTLFKLLILSPVLEGVGAAAAAGDVEDVDTSAEIDGDESANQDGASLFLMDEPPNLQAIESDESL